MKTLTTLLTATALTCVAGFAQADVRPDLISGLLESGAIASFEKLNQAALAKHPNATILDTELDHTSSGYVYEVELKDADEVKWKVKVDAKTAVVQSEKKKKNK
ncbi:PepSY domain-containing protein [Pseudomonas agarici]|uniref:PepSY domain-containing protein n=1 Tax=Pseudomonas agarici TaxID=46677 RepID=UPI00030F8A6E|nr:PepSY domain-containing protein [Pseudomonas agarici]NWB94059.1 PepSY domain-containing protein [Pseudomonas agarici]NWC11780.1 PepSY domain-containing protein [Pseudomonas agarici]SEL84784.1 Peptidase propeptide and YPEB domain-containing protein [Pseudomonas agarici]